jgi:hypothetical protein
MNYKKITIFLFAFCCLIFINHLKAFGQTANFRFVLEERLAKAEIYKNGKKTTGIRLDEVCPVDTDSVADRVFRDYGAMFIAGNGVRFPVKCVFADDSEVQNYQNSASPKSQNVGGTVIELQEPAMTALLASVAEAKQNNLKITPRGGSIAAKRSYQDTVDLWYSRFNPGLVYWTGKGKISRREAEMIKGWSLQKQVAQVLQWESKGYYFSKDLSKSILYSVAAPGASQHIFMLALDVEQYANKAVRDILAKHGWFQTVKSDLPHFTYLGVSESKLPSLGLKAVYVSGQKFWIPNLD